MIFFKILDFGYKGKHYTAFRNHVGYQTYLEYKEKEGEDRHYFYLDFETYREISEMFSRKKASFYEDSKFKKEKIKFIPKVLTSAGTMALVASLVACSPIEASASNPHEPSRLWPYKLFDRNEVIITEDYEVYELTKSINLLTSQGMELYWNDENNASFDDVRNSINENKNIDGELRQYLTNFIDNLEVKHPNINLTCFYHNAKSLRTKATGTQGMFEACGSYTATACFLADDCTIYYNPQKLDEENYEYIIYHEIGHMLVNGNKKVKNYETERHFTTGQNSGFMIEEGFNTLLIEEVMGVKIEDVAYRLPANYIEILMETTGYSFEDYVNGNHLDFADAISNSLNSEDFNVGNLPYLMEYQKYNVRQGKDVEIDDSEFYDLYSIIAACYFQQNLSSCTTKREIIELYDILIERITNQVYTKEGIYYFDFSGIEDTLFSTLNKYGISSAIWPSSNDLNTEVIIYAHSNSKTNTK